MSIQAYPLQWPDGWPRTTDRRFGRFSTKGQSSHGNWQTTKDITIAQALDRIHDEINKLDGQGSSWTRINPQQTVISTNLRVRKSDGQPSSAQSEPDDPGVAVYFELDGRRQCIPCDSYTKVAQNLAAVAATLAAIRTLERHGSGLMERAFTGFEALPDQSSGAWWAVLGVSPSDSRDTVEAAFRAKRRATHPDRPGGSHDDFIRVTEAWKAYEAQR